MKVFQKLKIQLIMINVILLSIVLLMVFTGMYFVIKQGMNQQAVMTMNGIAKEERVKPPIGTPDANRVLSGSFFIKVSSAGDTMEYSKGLSISKEDAEDIKKLALESEVSNGNIENNKYKLRFLKVPKHYGFIIVFLDNSLEIGVARWFIIASLLIGALSLAFVCLISLYLANKALVPIKNSWEKQIAFIADASHELRTPLAVVNSNLEIIVENEDETVRSQKKWLCNVQSELGRMIKLVEDLLFLARADTNEEDLAMGECNLSNLLSQVYEAFKPLTHKKGVKLILNNTEEVIVKGNQWRIKQLITIMLDNAMKHVDEGGWVELVLKTRESKIEITIRDNGEGIAKDELIKIFERFYRVDKSRSRKQGGAGLGLSIAKCIVNEHKGNIHVFSELGIGTEFLIVFPM